MVYFLITLFGIIYDLFSANPLGRTSLIILVGIFILRVGAKNIIIFTEKKLKKE